LSGATVADDGTVESLLQLVGVACFGLVVAVLRARWARNRQRAVRHGETVILAARLAGGTGRPRRGSVVLSPSAAGWYARRGGAHHDLAGAQILSSTVDTEWNARGDEVVVRLALPATGEARLILFEDDAATLVEVLHRGVQPEPMAGATPWGRPPRVGVLAVASLVLGAALFAIYVAMALTADTATATVTRNDGGGTCQVAWTRPGGRVDAGEVDCAHEPAGSALTVWVFSDDPGDIDTPAWFSGGMVGTALALAGPGVVATLVVRRRRRAWRAAHRQPPTAPSPVALPRSSAPVPADLVQAHNESPTAVLTRLAPHAARRVPEDGWEKPGLAAGARGPTTPRQVGRALLLPLLALLFVLGLTGSGVYGWFLLHSGQTATASGTSTGALVDDAWGPVPADLTVRYRFEGTTHVADVPVDRRIPQGEPVTIEYAVGHPGWARLTGPDDSLDREVGLALAGSLLVLLGMGGALVRLAGQGRSIRRAREEASRPGVGLLTADQTGAPVIVVCDPLVTPAQFVAVPLATPLPHGTARIFAEAPTPLLAVHGRPADGATVVLEIPDRQVTLLPRDRAFGLEPDDLRALLDPVGILVGTSVAAGNDGV
jgi:hypothetical protein